MCLLVFLSEYGEVDVALRMLTKVDEERVGGDDPDSIAAEDDWIGDDEIGDRRAGRLVATDQGLAEDHDHELVGFDVGIDGAGASAEEAAMHIIDGDDVRYDD